MGDWYRVDVIRFPNIWSIDFDDGVYGVVYPLGISGQIDTWVWQIKTKDGAILDQGQAATDDDALEAADNAHVKYMSEPYVAGGSQAYSGLPYGTRKYGERRQVRVREHERRSR